MGNQTGLIEFAFNAELGRKLAGKRKQRGLSQSDLAAQIGVHRNTVSHWECGDLGMSVWDFLRAADALCCQHVMMLPARGYVWGDDVGPMQRERDRHMRKDVQAERDPPLTAKEMLYGGPQ
jgi:DNA-binding XRE family transcriptional regulator